jgi:CDP-glucose 4,6-dehydratase
MPTCYNDIADLDLLRRKMQKARPEIVFHLAAQPLVGVSYQEPVSTYQTNVIGTGHLLETVRRDHCDER